MVSMTIDDQTVTFALEGWSRLWGFAGRLTIPLASIRGVRRAQPGVTRGWWKGWGVLGTHVPGFIVAGRFYRRGQWTFWDVRGAGMDAIVVELVGARYHQLFVDVADPDRAIERLEAARGARPA